MKTPTRQRPRLVPTTPITVAIDDQDTGYCLCYGVIANVSESGACVWTNGELAAGARLLLRVSFAYPPEVHEITGVVVWETETSDAADPTGSGLRRFGVEWQDAPRSYVERLRLMSLRCYDESLTPSGRLRVLERAELEP